MALAFEQHDDRYAPPANGSTFWTACGSRTIFLFGKYYRVEDNVLEPNQWRTAANVVRGRRIARAKELIAEKCDAI